MWLETMIVFPSRWQFLEQLADFNPARAGIQPAGRLVQQKHRRIVNQHPRFKPSRCCIREVESESTRASCLYFKSVNSRTSPTTYLRSFRGT